MSCACPGRDVRNFFIRPGNPCSRIDDKNFYENSQKPFFLPFAFLCKSENSPLFFYENYGFTQI
jgi:hypothetical protein